MNTNESHTNVTPGPGWDEAVPGTVKVLSSLEAYYCGLSPEAAMDTASARRVADMVHSAYNPGAAAVREVTEAAESVA